MPLFPRKQPHKIFPMRRPGKHVDGKNNQIGSHRVRVDCKIAIARKEEAKLYNRKSRNPQQRAQRAPFRKEDEEYNPPKQPKNDKRKPHPVTRQAKPKQAERGRILTLWDIRPKS